MVFIVKAHTICEVGGIGKAELLQFLIHQLYKGLLGSGDIVGKAQGRIGTGGEDGAVQQFPDRNCLSHHKTYHTAVIDIGIVCDVNGHGEGIVQVFHVFCGHQKGQDLGHGGGGDDGVGVFFGQDGIIAQVQNDGIAAIDLISQANGGTGFSGEIWLTILVSFLNSGDRSFAEDGFFGFDGIPAFAVGGIVCKNRSPQDHYGGACRQELAVAAALGCDALLTRLGPPGTAQSQFFVRGEGLVEGKIFHGVLLM